MATPTNEASQQPAEQKPVVVILPGLWHFTPVYESFRQRLEDEGYEAVTVAYPSAGAEPPNRALVHDSTAARLTLETLVSAGRQVIVLAHSYGGIVGQNSVYGLSALEHAKNDRSGGIIAFIYMAAFVGTKYSNMGTYASRLSVPWLKIDGSYVTCTDPIQTFFNDVEDAEKILPHITHACADVFGGTVLHEPWHDIPCVYIACSKDTGLPLEAQKKMASAITNVTSIELESGHSPYLSMPHRIVDIIKDQKFRGLEKGVQNSNTK